MPPMPDHFPSDKLRADLAELGVASDCQTRHSLWQWLANRWRTDKPLPDDVSTNDLAAMVVMLMEADRRVTATSATTGGSAGVLP